MEKVKIERPLYDQQQLRKDYAYDHQKEGLKVKSLCNPCLECQPVELLKKTIPVLEWLPAYNWKETFSSDVISGVTVAIMHMSQGMGYGMLGNVPPVVGIYMAFFPVLVYFFLGNSKHNSMGTFAVVCLMTGKVVLEQSDSGYSPTEVATCVTFLSAIVQLLMYTFRLGIVSTLLSETLVSGFTTGAAIHVFVSQVKDILGLKLPKEKGYFVNVLTVKNIFLNIETVNYVAIAISAVTIIISILNNEVLKHRVAKISKIPVPVELFLIVIGTVITSVLDLHGTQGLKIVGPVPSGLPLPKIPPLDLASKIWVDCVMIAIVSYTISLSMGLIFAQKYNYEVDANQELLAEGLGNLVGSFFSCMPFTASLSRSSIQASVGGKTQVVSLVSCSILVFVLLWIGPYFEHLPVCVLASVIVVALKSMLFQVKDFFKFLSLSKMDAAVWLVTFASVAFIGIDIGLLSGVVMSLLSIFILGLKPYTCLLGSVPNTDLYLDIGRYKGVKELFEIKIFHYQGSLNFASKNFFKAELCKAVEVYPQEQLVLRKKIEKLCDEQTEIQEDDKLSTWKLKMEKLERKTTSLKCIVLDFSALSYIDSSAITLLKLLSQEFKRIDIAIYIGGCSEPIYEMMCKCDLLNEEKKFYKVFPTVHDAVQHASIHYGSVSNLSTITTISRL